MTYIAILILILISISYIVSASNTLKDVEGEEDREVRSQKKISAVGFLVAGAVGAIFFIVILILGL